LEEGFAEKRHGFDPAGAMDNLRSSQRKLHAADCRLVWCMHGQQGGEVITSPKEMVLALALEIP
jgi:hypothetical protein